MMNINTVKPMITDEQYNIQIKEQFLSDLHEKTIVNYQRIFDYVQPLEKQFKKDLRYFTFDEMEQAILSFKTKNRNTAETYGRIISSYLNYCVANHYIKENVLMDLKPTDFDRYVYDEEHYITMNELIKMEDSCENYQDAVIMRLIYIGVGGRSLSELRHLKKSDVFEDRLVLTNVYKENKKGIPVKFTTRELPIDNRTYTLVKGAMEETTYTKRNGLIQEKPNIRPYTDLIENDYVLRASKTKNPLPQAPLDKFVIYRRLEMLEEYFGIELTTKLLQRSGMVHMGREIYEKTGSFDLTDVKIIAERFKVSSYHNLKSFLNEKKWK